jgi:hypothetical protein
LSFSAGQDGIELSADNQDAILHALLAGAYATTAVRLGLRQRRVRVASPAFFYRGA